MKFYSTNNPNHVVDLKEAVLKAFPQDRGLYLPVDIPVLSPGFWKNFREFNFVEMATHIAENLLGDELDSKIIEEIIRGAFNFPVPLVKLHDNLHILELFHGPTMAFKDFGARFMARLMSAIIKNDAERLTILVATSGDTGGAVASAFHGVESIDVIILYPSGRVSKLQEKQLTTWGDNITAIEIQGSFDDCQRLVKLALNDKSLSEQYSFSSANSINFARLMPQSFYYFEAYRQLPGDEPPFFVVPSGNLGNLTAGVLAMKMGLPVRGFAAAHNANMTFHNYIHSGIYEPVDSVQTLSSAMDVGDPSNFTRLNTLMGSTWNMVRKSVDTCTATNSETCDAMRKLYQASGYLMDPHTAVGYICAQREKYASFSPRVLISTAHPAKFPETVRECTGCNPPVPAQLKQFENRRKESIVCSSDYADLKNKLLAG